MEELNINRLISKFNFTPGSTGRIKYIVIHYTGAVGSAKSNAEYFAGGNRKASAHYFVGYDGEIWQSVEDKDVAWHCGAKKYNHPECRNANSIGIELCSKTVGSVKIADANWYFEDKTVEAAIKLTKALMYKYNVPADHVLRHYDVTGKICPAPYVYNTREHKWDEFKEAVMSDTSIKNIPDDALFIWKYLIEEGGFSEVATAGIMGNLYAESGLRANNLQNGYEKKIGLNDQQYTSVVDQGSYTKNQFINDKAGYGLAQWTYKTRKQALYDYVKNEKASIGDLKAQLSFLLVEMKSKPLMIERLRDVSTVREASDIILHDFERPADQSVEVEKKRAGYGETFYKLYAGGGKEQEETVKEIVPFLVRVNTPYLNIRKGPGTNFGKTGGYTGVGVYTITEVSKGNGSKSGWGKLKSGTGWISLDHTERI